MILGVLFFLGVLGVKFFSISTELNTLPHRRHIDAPTRDHYTVAVLAREDESGPLRQKIPNRVRA